MFSIAAASILVIAGTVLAEPLATITPCAASPWLSPITVTSQYQAVSTCAPSTECGRPGKCRTAYPFETFQYVSTVIPCAFNSSGGSSTTVTKTDQLVTVSRFRTTITSLSTPAGRRHARPTPVYSTVGQDYVLPFNKVGPLAIPGYGGSGLCTECGEDASGSRSQPIAVTECHAGPAGTHCVEYTKTLYSTSAPAATSVSAAACTTSFTAPAAGTYTFTFPHFAPARTITAHGRTFTVGRYPFNIVASRYFPHAGPWGFATTVTTTLTQTVPASTKPATATHPASVPSNWNHYPFRPRPSPPTSSSADPSTWLDWTSTSSSADPNTWLDWTSTSSSVASPSWGTSSWGTSSGSWDPVSSTSSWVGPSFTSASTTWSWSSSSTPTSTSTTYAYPTSTSTTYVYPTTASTTYAHPTSTTSWSTTTTAAITSAPTLGHLPPGASQIYVTANIPGLRYRKRAIEYLAFPSGGDGTLVFDVSGASRFYLINGYLLDAVTGEYVGTDTTTGSAPLEEFTNPAEATNNWKSSGGDLTFGKYQFCYTSDDSVLIVAPGSSIPGGCTVVVFGTCGVSTTTTTTTTTTTSWYPQGSGDLTERELESQEKEVEQPEYFDRRAVSKRHGLLHKH